MTQRIEHGRTWFSDHFLKHQDILGTSFLVFKDGMVAAAGVIFLETIARNSQRITVGMCMHCDGGEGCKEIEMTLFEDDTPSDDSPSD